jgi:pyruvate carboxylase
MPTSHSSPRLRTRDMTAIAPYYAALLPQPFSVECWGGATSMSRCALREDPGSAWRDCARHAEPAAADVAALGQRSYANYPDNLVRFFVQRAAAS